MTSIYLILVTKGFQSFDNARQLACYAGVAPFEYSSGSSIRGRTKVSHLADKKLKSLLNMCALNAKKHDMELKHYFERKVAEGKSKMLVLNNVRCKLIGRIFATVQRGTPYVNTQKFAA
jgi:transposase